MIHDAKIEITCDGCNNGSIEYDMPWVYSDYSGNNGYYDSNENDLVKFMLDKGWIIKGDKHFCCVACYTEGEG